MLITVGNYSINLADEVIDQLTANPFKFPRPNEVPAVYFEGGIKKPGMPFTYLISYLFSYLGDFMIRRWFQMSAEGRAANVGIQKTIYLYPWRFNCSLIPKQQLPESVTLLGFLVDREIWNLYFSLEINSASIKYKEKASQKNIIG